VLWDYSGDSSSFDLTADLQAIVNGVPVATLVSAVGNQAHQFVYSGQYTFTVTAGDTYGFQIGASNYDSADVVRGTLIVAVEPQLAPPPTLAAPVLIRALPSGSAVVPLLIGRENGLPLNAPITVRLLSGTTCTNGVLGGTVAQVGVDTPTTTDALDPAGIFGSSLGAAQGQFVAIQLTSPQVTARSNCVVTAADNDTWPKALRLTGNSVTVPDWIDAPGKARWYRFSILPGQSVQVTMSGLPADYDLAVLGHLCRIRQ